MPRRKDVGLEAPLDKSPIQVIGMKTHNQSGAGRVREILHLMPEQFTVIDIRDRLPDLPVGSSSAALRWCCEHGYVKSLGKVNVSEYRQAGHQGAPPVLYTYLGNGNVTVKAHKKYKKRSKPSQGEMGQSESIGIALAPLTPTPTQEVLVDEPPPLDRSPEILKTLTNALLVVQIASVIQDIPPEQALQIIGSMKHLSGAAIGRRR